MHKLNLEMVLKVNFKIVKKNLIIIIWNKVNLIRIRKHYNSLKVMYYLLSFWHWTNRFWLIWWLKYKKWQLTIKLRIIKYDKIKECVIKYMYLNLDSLIQSLSFKVL